VPGGTSVEEGVGVALTGHRAGGQGASSAELRRRNGRAASRRWVENAHQQLRSDAHAPACLARSTTTNNQDRGLPVRAARTAPD
jgi:hypothetical protein